MAVGPYSYGTKYGNLIVTSGQIAIDSDTNEVVTDIYKATKMVLESLLLVVENGGGSKNTIMKADVFLKDLKDFNVFNQAYSEFFGNHKPARVTVQAGDLAEGATIEIAVMAYAKE
jgi:2-iminobutanoate/2-iminopropanoate deaminase